MTRIDHDWHRIWISGASSGIGASLAQTLAAPGRSLILSGRSTDRLQDVAGRCTQAGATVRLLPFDMADAPARTAALAELTRDGLQPDLLINNAGISQRGTAAETDVAVDRRIMEVDYLAAVELTKSVLPGMLQRGRGSVVAISSVAGLAPVPLRSSYNAAKAAQLAFFGTLANECAGTGVTVHLVVPGFVRTDVSRNALNPDGSPAGVMDPNQAKGISPDQAAAEIVRGLRRGRRRIYTGITARLRVMLLLARLAPGLLDRILQNTEVR